MLFDWGLVLVRRYVFLSEYVKLGVKYVFIEMVFWSYGEIKKGLNVRNKMIGLIFRFLLVFLLSYKIENDFE